jgi:nucleoside phosphorylase
MGKHKVVVAVLPHGDYGTTSAAIVARDMLHSFPNIKICLMVGIGGGVPSQKHDIRLGDVVVSAVRNDGTSGVIQYDFGKTVQGQTFQETKFLNKPPIALRTAMNKIRCEHERNGHNISETIEAKLNKNKRLRKIYAQPAPNSDRLYKASVVHSSSTDNTNCIESCGENPTDLIHRQQRDEYEDNPTIHYGLIASGNRVMKDALFRDKLGREKDILCFEMEAAGLMDHFPCLVIRGICDYSDSHKCKEWQGYAAMTAAAYAREFLSVLSPDSVEKTERIKDVLSSSKSTD